MGLPHTPIVEEFNESDPVYGPVVKTLEKVVYAGYIGAGVGGIATGRNAWKWSKNPYVAVLPSAFGTWVGFGLGIDAGRHWYQLYRMDAEGSKVKFYEWMEKRGRGESE